MMNGNNEIQEEWKPVKGWECLYKVSNNGRIMSIDRVCYIHNCKGVYYIKRIKGSEMTLRYDKDGYKVVHLMDSSTNRNKLLKVHRLVADAFVENPNNYTEIYHINGIRYDNRSENLRWCTVEQNNNFEHAIKNKSKSIKKSYENNYELRKLRAETFSKCNSQTIIILEDGIELKRYKRLKDFLIDLNIKKSHYDKYIKPILKYKNYTLKIEKYVSRKSEKTNL